MSDRAQIMALFRAILESVEESRNLLAQGETILLEGMEVQVAELCRTIQAMPHEEAMSFQPHLELLTKELEVLGLALVAERDAVGAQLTGMTSHREAAVKYRTSEAIDGGREEENED